MTTIEHLHTVYQYLPSIEINRISILKLSRFKRSLCVLRRLRLLLHSQWSSTRKKAAMTTATTTMQLQTCSLPRRRLTWLLLPNLWWSPNQILARLSFENLCRLLNNNNPTSTSRLPATPNPLRWCLPLSPSRHITRLARQARYQDSEIGRGRSSATFPIAIRLISSPLISRLTTAFTQVIIWITLSLWCKSNVMWNDNNNQYSLLLAQSKDSNLPFLVRLTWHTTRRPIQGEIIKFKSHFQTK